MVRKQRKASFIDKHCDQYGLKIVTSGPKGNVDSVVCRFCVTFGREDDDDCGVGNNNGSNLPTAGQHYSLPLTTERKT